MLQIMQIQVTIIGRLRYMDVCMDFLVCNQYRRAGFHRKKLLASFTSRFCLRSHALETNFLIA